MNSCTSACAYEWMLNVIMNKGWLHTMCTAWDAYTTYTYTMNRVQLRSTEETCSIISPCAYMRRITVCILFWVYSVLGVFCSGCALFWVYSVLGVWCTLCGYALHTQASIHSGNRAGLFTLCAVKYSCAHVMYCSPLLIASGLV